MFKLSQKERDIIAAAELRADAPVSDLRKLTGYRDHTIRYFVQRALDRGIMRRRCFINLNVIGYSQFQIYFSLSSKKKESRAEVIKSLINSEKVSWLGECGGEYQYGVNICVKSVHEVWDFLDSLSGRFGAIFLEKVIALRISLSFFGNKYLSPRKKPQRGMSYGVCDRVAPYDRVDHDILQGLTSRSYGSYRELARLLGLPQTTLDYRLRRLRQEGVVAGLYYEVQPALIGMQSFLVLVCVKGISREFREEFLKFCGGHPNIVLVIHSIGSWDFEVVIEVAEARESTGIAQEFQDRFSGSLNWIKILPLFSYLKVAEYPFERYGGAA